MNKEQLEIKLNIVDKCLDINANEFKELLNERNKLRRLINTEQLKDKLI